MPTNHNFTYTSYLKGKIVYPKNIKDLKKYLKLKHTIIGNLRSYGDTCIGKNSIHISLRKFSKIISINEKKKILEVQSGLLLKDLFSFVINRNLILECLPGCKYVTIGGMIANNIHGKLLKNNSIISRIISMKIIRNNYQLVECSRKKNKELFYLTVGGKGCTGPIVSVKLSLDKLPSKTIYQKLFYFHSKKNFIERLKNVKKFKFAVTWLDFTKKNFQGIILCSDYSKIEKSIQTNKDLNLPSLLIKIISIFSKNKLFIYLFNGAFNAKNFFFPKKFISLNDSFFPQNKILNWNMVYKKYGFVQLHFYFKIFQLNLIDKIRENLIKNQIYSNFAVIKFHEKKAFKKFQNLSLSIDIPLNNNKDKVVNVLNNIVEKYDLHVNLSKDIILNELNNKTYLSNKIFMKKNEKYLMKNKTSGILDRFKSAK